MNSLSIHSVETIRIVKGGYNGQDKWIDIYLTTYDGKEFNITMFSHSQTKLPIIIDETEDPVKEVEAA